MTGGRSVLREKRPHTIPSREEELVRKGGGGVWQ